jgi:hypothetical protein
VSADPDSRTQSAKDSAPAIDPGAPVVPAALIPGVEQPARRPRAPLWQSLAAFVLVVVVLAVVGWGAGIANARWGSQAMTVTAVHGVEALIQGDADGLVVLATPNGRATLTPAVRVRIEQSGAPARFSPFVWVDGTAEVTGTVGSHAGRLVAAPDPNGASVVTFETNGALMNAVGAVSLERDWNGWLIAGFSLQAVNASSTPPASQP